MNAKDAPRAAMLVKALGQIEAVARDLKKPAREGYDRVMEIGAPEVDPGGSSCDSDFHLPPDFGETLLPLIEAAIREELKRLGVQV